MNEKVFLLSKEEFVMLAAASGIRQMYGFSIAEEIEEEKALQAMQKLAEKGLLLSIDGKFQVQEPAAEIFRQIKEEKAILDVHKKSGKKCIVYLGEFGVKVSMSARREGMLEVQPIPLNEIWKYLTEEGWIPAEKEAIQ